MGLLVTGLPSHRSQGETYLPVKYAHIHNTLTHTQPQSHTHWLESRQINLRDRSEDAASYREGQTQHSVGEGEGPAAAGMKSQHINIHEPSHLSERDSSVSGTGGREGGRGEEERKEGSEGGDWKAGWVRGCLGSQIWSQSNGRYAYLSCSLE